MGGSPEGPAHRHPLVGFGGDAIAGANPKAVQRMLDHASAAMTLDTYANLFEVDLDNASERLDATRSQTVVAFSWGLDGLDKQKAP